MMGHTNTILLLCVVIFLLAKGIQDTGNSCVIDKKDKYLKCTNLIPTSIPDGVTKVELVTSSVVLSNSLFSGNGWSNITSLAITSSSLMETVEFKDSCFGTLIRLEELYIHVIRCLLDTNTFSGLRNLKTLDLTNSTDIQQYELIRILVSPSLPKLQTLSIAGVGIEYGYDLDEEFWKKIETLKISFLDISYVRAKTFNATSIIIHSKYLRTLIARGLFVGVFYEPPENLNVLLNIEVLDISKDSSLGIAFCVVSQFSDYKNIVVNLDRFRALSTVRELLLDNICEGHGRFHNLTNIRNISFESAAPVNLKSLSINNNGLAYVDITFSSPYPQLKSLSAYGNTMEYLNPNALGCVYALRKLDLSNNILESMNRQNSTHFQDLLKSLTDLRNLNLSRNRLSSIPRRFFSNNGNIETIDLSGNELKQVYFETKHLKNLMLLNLSNNEISVLDANAMNSLDALFQFTQAKVDLTKNALSCSKCTDLDLTQWLFKNRYNIVSWNTMECLSEDGEFEVINASTSEKIDEICRRRKIIILCSTSAGISLCFAVLVAFLTQKYLKRKKTTARLNDVLRKIVDKQPGHEFVAFLSFSSDDQDTVLRYMLLPFEQKLKQIIGVERDLICLGDKHFQVGYPILHETLRCLKMSCVVVFVVSDSFSQSEFCRNEFLQAYEIGKPIILIVKEECDEDLMPPLLKDVFLKNTRIIWLTTDEDFTLRTTWENICHSILELCAANV